MNSPLKKNHVTMALFCLAFAASAFAVNVSQLGSWVQGTTHAKESGSNRALVVMLYGEGNADISAASVIYGGQAMTKVVEKSFTNGTYSYTGAFVLNESAIAAASTGAIAVTWSKAPSTGSNVVSVFLSNVNQASLVGATVTGSIVGTTVTAAAPANAAGDMILVAGTAANNGTYTINNGFTRGIPETSASFGDITSAFMVATGAAVIPSLTQSSSQRQTLISFAVKVSGTVQNQPPAVSISSPANGASFAAPASVTVNVTAGDADGSVNKVELRSNGTLVGTDNSSPYSFTIGNLAQGSYTLEARAYDNANATTNSSVAISVTAPVVGESVPWQESFTLANGAKSDIVPTSWTATRSSGTFMINGNRLMINGGGSVGVLTTGVIDISAGKVAVSMDLLSQGNLESNQDYVKLFKKVNGGSEVLIGEKWGNQTATTITDTGISGNTLQLVVRTYVSASDEYFYLDNLSITKKAAKTWQPLGTALSKSSSSYADMVAVNGVTYVAVADPNFANRLTVYMHYGTVWEPLGNRGFSDNAIVSVKLGQENGDIYALYVESNTNGGLSYVKKFNGASWETVCGAPVSTIGASAEDIKISGGKVYVSYTEVNTAASVCYYGVPMVVAEATYAGWQEIGGDCTYKYDTPYTLNVENGVLYRESHYADDATAGMHIDRFNGTTWDVYAQKSNIIQSSEPVVAFDGTKAYFVTMSRTNSGLNCEMFDGTNWSFVGKPDFIIGQISNLSVTVSNGKPYIAFDKAGLLSVVTFNNNAWELVGPADFSNAPWVGDYGYGFNGKILINGITPQLLLSANTSPTATVMQFPAGTPDWKNIARPLFKAPSSDANLAEVNGVKYVAVSDPEYGKRLTVYKQSGTSWVPVGTRGFSDNAVNHPVLAQDNGELYVLYMESNTYSGYVKKLVGTSWQTMGNTSFTAFGDAVYGVAIKSGIVYVSYTEQATYGNTDCYYGQPTGISKFNGVSWQRIMTGCTGKFDSPYEIGLVNGILYAEIHEFYYTYSSFVSLMSYDGTAWNNVTRRDLLNCSEAGMQVLLDGNKIAIGYRDDATKAFTVDKFDGTAWISTSPQTLLNGAKSNSSLTFTNGKPYIACDKNGTLSVISYNGTTWAAENIPVFSSNGILYFNVTAPTVIVAPNSSADVNVLKFE